MESVLSIDNVTKRFGDFTAVRDFSLAVPQGELVGFLGPNGAGKTTTIRMIMNIIAPDEGRITILGRSSASDVKDRVGYLPEERGLYRKMTVEATLRYFGKLKGITGATLSQRVDAWLQRIELTEWRKRRVEALSKGMQQKVQFAVTQLQEPELVILDEPFSGLDPLNVELLKGLVLELRNRGTTVLFSTHVMEQAERLCDRLVLINRGKRVVTGTLAEIRERFPARTLELEGTGDFDALTQRPDVRHAQIGTGRATLELVEGADPHELLTAATNTLRLTRFELRQPTLQEIFVQLVGHDNLTQQDAAALGATEVKHG